MHTFVRIFRSTLLLLLIASGSLIATPTLASADHRDECYVALDAPGKIKINRPYKAVDVYLYDSCGVAEYASFELYGPRGWDHIFIFDGQAGDIWDIYQWRDLGTFRTRLSNAWDVNSDDLEFHSSTIKVKLGTKAAVNATRSGKYVNVAVTSRTYDVWTEGYRPWSASRARIQYKTSTGWKTLKSVKLKKGKAAYRYKTTKKRTYRFVTSDSAVRFGSTSKTDRA